MKEIVIVIKHIIKEAEKNLQKAIDRKDYSAAAKAESYLSGLNVSLEVVKAKMEAE